MTHQPEQGQTLDEQWTATAGLLPTNGIVVDTKIDDGKNCHNEQKLIRKGNLWFLPDMSMYVYYRPTHWRNP